MQTSFLAYRDGADRVAVIDTAEVAMIDKLAGRDSGTDGTLDECLYYCNDANMNVTALVDSASGTVVERVAYDPYGKPTFYDASWQNPTSTSARANEILYGGYRWDPETGQYQVRRRYYQPALGRWVTADPVGYASGLQLYEYCHGRASGLADYDGSIPRTVASSLGYQMRVADSGAATMRETDLMGDPEMQRTYTMGTVETSTDPGGYSMIRTASGETVGYEQALVWASKSAALHSQAAWNRFVKTHDPNSCCGADVTKQVKEAVQTTIPNLYMQAGGAVASRKETYRDRMCHNLMYVGGNVFDAWDIYQLRIVSQEGPRGGPANGWGEPGRSVRYNKKCYDAAAVNYIAYGRMCRICANAGSKWVTDLNQVISKARKWKTSIGSVLDSETEGFIRAGWDGNVDAAVPSITPYSLAKPPDPNPILDQAPYNVTWGHADYWQSIW